jgi:hypothetical protein
MGRSSKKIHKRKIQILAFANNHYAGYGLAQLSSSANCGGELGRRTETQSSGGPRSTIQMKAHGAVLIAAFFVVSLPIHAGGSLAGNDSNDASSTSSTS